ncbi:hypothetical protein PDESU_00890 [Pontiella desulfatans]|uniref:Fibronectin type-III domain-containing protein n=1 Tax=Pontiella desulfatans TaxID=2750659 RepID=A0A6C2TXC4_PONDE|nr:DUF2341 domain-containing protein [Pontiella desulfatans]VGO12338.1 hypothetical protein PDESU_00890 [Pontiella desulfatans]
MKTSTRLVQTGMIAAICVLMAWPSIGHAAKSKGTIKVLGVRVVFKDAGGPSEKTIEQRLNSARLNYGRFSYGKLDIIVRTATVKLPNNRTSYSGTAMKAAARAKLKAQGILIGGVEIFGFYPGGTHFGSHATVGGNEFISSSTGGSTMHEMGHNFGWGHQSRWASNNSDPIGSGKLVTPDVFHFMKTASMDPEPSEKWGHGWITDRHTVYNNGSYTKRLYTFDQKNIASANRERTIRVTRNTLTKKAFWLGYRSRLLNNVSGAGKNTELRQGLCFWWERSSAASTTWLDMHTGGGLDNHSIQPGETYSDTAGDVYITNLGRGGSEPNEYLDVRINRGTFAGNGAPVPTWDAPAMWKKGAKLTITIEGNDPDGDEVACMWTTPERDIVYNTSAPTLTVTPSKLGNWQVKAVVSDMKGKTKTISKTITIVSAWPVSDWDGSDSAGWNTAANWTPEEIPNDRSESARWNSNFTGAFQLATTAAKTLRGLELEESLTRDVTVDMTDSESDLFLWENGIKMLASDHDLTITGSGSVIPAVNQTWFIGTGGGAGELNVLTEIDLEDRNLTINTVTDAEVSSIAGEGTFTKKGVGALTLSGTSSHSGSTQVTGTGSLLIDGTLAGGGTVGAISAATLGGTGTIANNVTVESEATLSPGPGYGSLAISGGLTLNGDLLMDVDRSGPTNDQLNLTGTLTLAGSARLRINNQGEALQNGDTFQLSDTAVAGAELLDITPTPGYPLAWGNHLASNGTVEVYLPGTLLSNSNGASNVAYDSATLTGELNTNDAPTEVRVYWGTSDGGINTNAWDHMASFGSVSSAQSFSTNVTGLSELTPYYYRFYGVNSNRTAWAETEAEFRTPAAPLVPANFQYSMEITFPNATGSLTNFPALVILDEAKSLFRYAQMASSAGDDLRFTAIDGTTILNYEIENWNTESNSQVWVQVPLLTNNTTIVAHWGNTNGVASPAYTTDGSTWTEGFEGVWHMTGDEATDSSPNARDTIALNDVDSTDGVIADARTFDGTDDSLVTSEYPGVTDGGRTVTAWIKSTATNAAITGWGNEAPGEHLEVGLRDGVLYADVNSGHIAHGAVANDDQWHHAAVVIPDDGTPNIDEGLLYLDGAVGQSAVLSQPIQTASGPNLRLGETETGNLDWNGELDEVRVSSIARSANWVGAAYLNMASNDAFNSLYDVAGIEVPMISDAGSVSALMPYTVTLNAELLTTGAASTTVFVCYGQEDGGTVASTSAWEVVENLGIASAGPISFDATNLYANTEYFFRFAATNSFAEAWTKMGAFQTPEDIPVIENNGISGIQETSVSLGGNLTSTGFAATTVHVYWGDEDAAEELDEWDLSANLGTQSTGTLSTNITGLTADTTYYYRYYATNAYGDAWASETTAFTTPSSTLDTNRYGFKMKIEFPGYDGTETLTNFPALVVFNEALSNFHYGAFASLDGGDLRFTAEDGTTVLNYETENWSTNGDSAVWVQIPALSSNTFVWAYGGNPGAVVAPPYTTDGSTWSEGFEGVWHLSDALGLDSTANGHDATVLGGPTNIAGQAGDALFFDGVDDTLQVPYSADLNPSNLTVSLWGRVDGKQNDLRAPFSNRRDGPNEGFICFANSANNWQFQMGNGSTWAYTVGPAVSVGSWTHLTGTYDQRSSNQTLYVDGSNTAESVTSGYIPNPDTPLNIGSGSPDGSDHYFKGPLDEMRISSVVRSADWVDAVHFNMGSNSAFNSYGAAAHEVPVVSNDGGPTNLTPTSATLQGALLDSGSDPAEVIVFHGEFDGGKNINAWDAAVPLGVVSEGPLSINVTNLSPETEHYYRFYASNASGANWALATTEVVPPSGRPVLDELPESTNVTGVSATIISDLVSTGNAPTTVWAYWGTTDAGITNTAWQNSENLGVHSASFISNTVAGLIPGETYYYRFQATNHWGESWTEASYFTTEAMTPNLVATHAGSTLDINTDAKTLTYDADGAGPIAAVVHTASIEANTATWTFGEIHIGADTTLTFGGNDSRAIRLIADGTGYLSEGNIIIEKDFNLNGDNGGQNGANGGSRTFGSGAGGDDKTGADVRGGESAASDAYTTVGGKGGGRNTDSSTASKGGGGGAFGGDGGDSNTGTPAGGSWYGRLDLAKLGTSGGPRAGSGGGAGNRGAGGAGGGAIQLLAINDITISAGTSITAKGGRGNSSGTTTADKRRTGGGGSGGGIRIVADSDGDGFGTLDCSGATLSAPGGVSDSGTTSNEYGGDGGGGRVVLRGATVIQGVIDVAGGDHVGSNGKPGEDGSIFRDGKNGELYLSGNGRAANTYSSYTNLNVTEKSTWEFGGDENVMSVVISNSTPAIIDGKLELEIDGTNSVSDQLIVTSDLDITGATLQLNELSSLINEVYVLAEYGAITGAFASVTGLPADYTLQYNYGTNGNQIALVTTSIDGDGDGIIDAWEIDQLGSTTLSDGTGNQDGDAFTDLQEYIADTDPDDTNSFLWIAIAQSTNTGIHELSFPSSAEREYWIESTTNLVIPFSPTSPAFPGEGGIMLRDTTNSLSPNRHYRVRVTLP